MKALLSSLFVLSLFVAPISVQAAGSTDSKSAYSAESLDHGHDAHDYSGAGYGADAHGGDYEGAHGGDHGHGKKKAGLPQLNPKWYVSQIFWLGVMFTFMYLPFRFKVIPDLSSVIERRREQIEGDLIAARNLKQEAEDIHGAYEKILQDAREEASSLFIRAEEKIKLLEQQTFDGFVEKAADQVAGVEAEIKAGKEKAMDSINDVVADVAAEASKKLAGIEVDKDFALGTLKAQNDNKNRKAA